MNDIVPDLLKKIQDDFFIEYRNNKKLKELRELLENNNATYIEANDYALEIGDILVRAFKKNIKSDILPEGRMFFNIGDRILNPTLSRNYDLVSNFTIEVQKQLNKKIGLGIKPLNAKKNINRIYSLVNKLDSEIDFEEIKWLLDAPIIDFTQQVVNEILQENMNFQYKSGLKPKIIRTLVAGACDWCVNLAGTYIYPNVPEEVYKRHDRCRCTVEYIPERSSRQQDVWSKKWR